MTGAVLPRSEPAAPLRFGIVIPVYNHALTVGRVVRGAGAHFPVIAVDDGSTDGTGRILAAEPGVTVVTLPFNQGKGAALRAGFARAEALGFTHVITLDADGQLAPEEVPWIAAASRQQPEALIVGVRDLVRERAPRLRRLANRASTIWFRAQTGVPLPDTQCGFRGYPLQLLRGLRAGAERYAYELEVLVRAAWAGVAIVPQAVSADYAAATSRRSHFHPAWDLARIALLQWRLTLLRPAEPARPRLIPKNGLTMLSGRRLTREEVAKAIEEFP